MPRPLAEILTDLECPVHPRFGVTDCRIVFGTGFGEDWFLDELEPDEFRAACAIAVCWNEDVAEAYDDEWPDDQRAVHGHYRDADLWREAERTR